MNSKILTAIMATVIVGMVAAPVQAEVPHFTADGVLCDTFIQGASVVQGFYEPGVHCFNGAVSIPGNVFIDHDTVMFVNGAVNTGAGSSVESFDSQWQIVGAFNTGAASHFSGQVVATGGSTTGATSFIFGSVSAGTAITTGAGSQVFGDLESRTAAITLGADSRIHGHVISPAAVTMGSSSLVFGCVESPTITVGINAKSMC